MGSSGSTLSSSTTSTLLDFFGRDGLLHATSDGRTVQFSIKGINWFGSEAYNGPPGGLSVHGLDWYMDFLKANDFNAIRLLFTHEYVLKNDIVEAPEGAGPSNVLFQVRYIEMFLALSRAAAKRGILIMVACHRVKHDAWPGAGLWYDDALGFSEAKVMESWALMASALCAQWNVFAADLQNEPHAASWGKGLAIDWNKGAETLGNHVLSVCPRWLIFVEGVGYDPGAPGADRGDMGIWWGSNLVGARVAEVKLSDQEKLVYSPHVYGPSVYQQAYFNDFRFPSNMPDVWNAHFAFAKALTKRPIVLGEIGGMYIGQDKQWQDWALPFMKAQGFGLFYFALNPDSEDTGGLVPKDWSAPAEGSVEAKKLEALSRFPSTDVLELCPRCANASTSSLTAYGSGGEGGAEGGGGGMLPKNPVAAVFLLATLLVGLFLMLMQCFCGDSTSGHRKRAKKSASKAKQKKGTVAPSNTSSGGKRTSSTTSKSSEGDSSKAATKASAKSSCKGAAPSAPAKAKKGKGAPAGRTVELAAAADTGDEEDGVMRQDEDEEDDEGAGSKAAAANKPPPTSKAKKSAARPKVGSFGGSQSHRSAATLPSAAIEAEDGGCDASGRCKRKGRALGTLAPKVGTFGGAAARKGKLAAAAVEDDSDSDGTIGLERSSTSSKRASKKTSVESMDSGDGVGVGFGTKARAPKRQGGLSFKPPVRANKEEEDEDNDEPAAFFGLGGRSRSKGGGYSRVATS